MEKSTTYKRYQARMRRRKAIRKKLNGSADRPRMVVFRSAKHIYAQIINDEVGRTLVAMSTISKDIQLEDNLKRTQESFEVGLKLGEKALAAGIKQVCFDRNGFKYHGRIKALADGARKAGLSF